MTRFETARVGQPGRYTFDAVAGQSFTVRATASATFPTGATVKVYQPSGSIIASTTANSSEDLKLDLASVPATGVYTIVVTPLGLDTGTIDLRLIGQASDTLDIDAPPKTFTLATGQNGRYTFAANAGEHLALGYTALATTPAGGTAAFSVLKPDGTYLAGTTASGPGSWQLPQLPLTGLYTLTVKPSGTSAATFTLLVSRAVTGTVATDGSSTHHEVTRPGQSGRFTFSASSGESYTLQATAGATFPSGVTVTAYQPSGASIGSATISNNSSVKLDLDLLPQSGTYTAVVTPKAVGTGSVDLRVIPHADVVNLC